MGVLLLYFSRLIKICEIFEKDYSQNSKFVTSPMAHLVSIQNHPKSIINLLKISSHSDCDTKLIIAHLIKNNSNKKQIGLKINAD